MGGQHDHDDRRAQAGRERKVAQEDGEGKGGDAQAPRPPPARVSLSVSGDRVRRVLPRIDAAPRAPASSSARRHRPSESGVRRRMLVRATVAFTLAATSTAYARDARDADEHVKLRPGLTLEVGGGDKVTLRRDGSDDQIETAFCRGLVERVEWNRHRTALTFRCVIELNDGEHRSTATVSLAEIEATYEEGVGTARRAAKRNADAEPHLARALALRPTLERAFALAAVRLRLGQRAAAADVVRPYLARAPADIYAQILLDPELAPLADVPGLLAAPALPGTAVIGPDGPSISGAPFAATDDLIAFVARLGAVGQPEVETVTLVVVDRRTGAARAELRLWRRGVAPSPNLAIANRFLRDLGFVTPAGLELAGAPDGKRRLRLP